MAFIFVCLQRKASLPVTKIQSVKTIRKGARDIPKAFEIFTNEQTYVLKAKDTEHAEKWIQCLQIAVARTKSAQEQVTDFDVQTWDFDKVAKSKTLERVSKKSGDKQRKTSAAAAAAAAVDAEQPESSKTAENKLSSDGAVVKEQSSQAASAAAVAAPAVASKSKRDVAKTDKNENETVTPPKSKSKPARASMRTPKTQTKL